MDKYVIFPCLLRIFVLTASVSPLEHHSRLHCIWGWWGRADTEWHFCMWHFCLSICKIFFTPAAVNEKAIKLNETLGIQDKAFERNLQGLQKEIDQMMGELRRKNLDTQKEVAEDELV